MTIDERIRELRCAVMKLAFDAGKIVEGLPEGSAARVSCKLAHFDLIGADARLEEGAARLRRGE